MPINIAKMINRDNRVILITPKNGKERTLRQATYKAWKKAVLTLDSKASFTGDKDIDSSFKKNDYDAEWDGTKGYITFNEGKTEND